MPDLIPLLMNGRWLAAAIVAFGAMIFFHELGHFLMAKRAGVTVYAFALGFGPRLLGFRRGETLYSINLLPFGGYVKMAGEDFDETETGDAGSFRNQPVWERIAIVAAGPLMNLLLAVVILAFVAATVGVAVGVTNRIASLQPGWPAEQVGLRPGDEIVAINGNTIEDGQEMLQTIHGSGGRELTLTVRRGDQTLTVVAKPRLGPDGQRYYLGFQPVPVRARFNLLGALVYGFQRTGEIISTLLVAIVQLIRAGEFFQNLGGPLAAGRALVDAGRTGFENFLYMTAFLSVVIGIFNLFPFPALDGGRLVFLIVEAVRRRRVDPRREGYIHLVGFALLILLLVFLTTQDIRRIW